MRTVLVAVINFYQKWISPSFAPRCKYYPSCSTYAASAISNYGIRGVGMALWRLLRCNPWSHGGVDYAVKTSSLNEYKTTEKNSVGAK
jgi:putative membrane protein insertion efficiency factor